MANLENYSIIKNLGSGAFGQVKRNPYSVARHILTQTPVAIKVIKKKLAQEQGVLRNIKFEARFLQSFSHPNIIKL
jgi:serine/threonine protein kinase